MSAVVSFGAEKSTTVRMFSVPPLIRTAFRVLDHTAPWLSARWAERIWFTLPRLGTSSPQPTPTATGGASFTVDVDGHPVVGNAWGDGPVVYLMHGWAGHAGQL